MSVSSLPYFFFSILRPPPTSTLFPYTTLVPISWSRSGCGSCCRRPGHRSSTGGAHNIALSPDRTEHRPRSEEHTSELQSRGHLVCRLLLEKKKKKTAQQLNEYKTTVKILSYQIP